MPLSENPETEAVGKLLDSGFMVPPRPFYFISWWSWWSCLFAGSQGNRNGGQGFSEHGQTYCPGFCAEHFYTLKAGLISGHFIFQHAQSFSFFGLSFKHPGPKIKGWEWGEVSPVLFRPSVPTTFRIMSIAESGVMSKTRAIKCVKHASEVPASGPSQRTPLRRSATTANRLGIWPGTARQTGSAFSSFLLLLCSSAFVAVSGSRFSGGQGREGVFQPSSWL